ncbi:hypothetical protein ABBQ38_005613 [Trebouxia sp. C0009 RCD-2024]
MVWPMVPKRRECWFENSKNSREERYFCSGKQAFDSRLWQGQTLPVSHAWRRLSCCHRAFAVQAPGPQVL